MFENALEAATPIIEHTKTGHELLAVNLTQINKLKNLHEKSFRNDYVDPNFTEQRTLDQYFDMIGRDFGAARENIREMLQPLEKTRWRLLQFLSKKLNLSPISVWDFGASTVALPELFAMQTEHVRSHMKGTAVNLYPHGDLSDRIKWKIQSLESPNLFAPNDKVDLGFCISTASYLVDPFAFVNRLRAHIADRGKVWISPFINASRLHLEKAHTIEDWFARILPKHSKVVHTKFEKNISLIVDKFFPQSLPVLPVLDVDYYKVRYDRKNALIRTADDLIFDAVKYNIAPKLSYKLL